MVSEEKKLGKIASVRLGAGGYDDAMFGLTLDFRFGGGTGCTSFTGFWSSYPTHAQYTRESWEAKHAETFALVRDLCRQAKVRDVTKLEGVPIEATFEGMTLKDWRILEEVL